MKRLPINVSDFKILQHEHGIYIDKTKQIYELVRNGLERFYFICRPRRFGKSLLVSTLAALFQGERELFQDTWIGQSDYDFKPYPVVHLDFSKIAHSNANELDQSLKRSLKRVASEFGVEGEFTDTIQTAIESLIEQLYKRHGPVVILIDEYDAPIATYFDQHAIAQANRKVLKKFFITIKGCDKYLRFLLDLF